VRSLFVNLPVSDLAVTRAFWTGLGFAFDEQYSDDSAACLVVEQNVFAMLLVRERFADFVNGEVADAFATTEVLLCLSCTDRDEVDALLARALDTGAKPWKPTLEAGPMYGASFQDPDGHVGELMAMAPQG
jgi:predicted lactoylglutathione lyase